jgi:hypothetical protein
MNIVRMASERTTPVRQDVVDIIGATRPGADTFCPVDRGVLAQRLVVGVRVEAYGF